MRVVAILHLYPPAHNAGAEWMTHTLLRDLVQHGHEVSVVLTAATGPEYELDGVTVHPANHKSDPARFAQDADILITHLENTSRTTALARILHKPMVHILHNTFEPSKRWLTPDTDLAVFNSEWMAEDYAKYWVENDHPGVRSVVINPPVVAEDYTTISGDHVTLINLTEAKGALIFWELAARMPDVKFLGVIGGYGHQVIPQNPPPNVVIQSHTPGHDMKHVYGLTKILLMPSEYESWGRVGVEAMASGIPVIANPTPGLRESLGGAGIFVSRRDIIGWEERIRFLMDGRRYRTAARKARERSRELNPSEDLRYFRETLEDVHAHYPGRYRS